MTLPPARRTYDLKGPARLRGYFYWRLRERALGVNQHRLNSALGNFFLEAASLIGVFGLLEPLMRGELKPWWAAGVVGTTIFFFVAGLYWKSKVDHAE